MAARRFQRAFWVAQWGADAVERSKPGSACDQQNGRRVVRIAEAKPSFIHDGWRVAAADRRVRIGVDRLWQDP